MGVLAGSEVSLEGLFGYNKLQDLLGLIISHLNEQEKSMKNMRETQQQEAEALRRQSAEALERAEAMSRAATERLEASERAAVERDRAASLRLEAAERAASKASSMQEELMERAGSASLAGEALERMQTLEATAGEQGERIQALEAKVLKLEAVGPAIEEQLASTTRLLREERFAASKEAKQADAELRAAIDALPAQWSEDIGVATGALREEVDADLRELESRIVKLEEDGTGLLNSMTSLQGAVADIDAATLKTRKELLSACDEARSQCLKIAEAAGDLRERMTFLEQGARGRGAGVADELSAACESVGRLEGEIGALQSKMDALSEKEVVDVESLASLIKEMRRTMAGMVDRRASATTKCLACHAPRKQSSGLAGLDDRTIAGSDGKLYRRGRQGLVHPGDLQQTGGPGSPTADALAMGARTPGTPGCCPPTTGPVCAEGHALLRPASAPGLKRTVPLGQNLNGGAGASLRRYRPSAQQPHAVDGCLGSRSGPRVMGGGYTALPPA